MKRLFVLVLILTARSFISSAQDVIIMKNGDEVKAKVTEVETNEIKYKKSDNLDGPVISVLKSDVFMIKYSNGSKDVFTDKPKYDSVNEASIEVSSTNVIYGGVSDVLSGNNSDVKIGFVVGFEGFFNINDPNIHMVIDFGYTYNPVSSFRKYSTIYGLLGFRFTSTPSNVVFYFSAKAGMNITFSNSSGIGFAFSPQAGIIISQNLNIGIKYLHAIPSLNGNIKIINPIMLTMGYEF